MTRPRLAAPRTLPVALLALLLVPGAAADCTRSEPCTLRVDLDDGVRFDGSDETTVRQYHWYVLDVLNQADGNHTLTLANHTFTASGYDAGGPRSRHGPLPFPDAGELTLRDETAGHDATIRVEPGPPPEPEPQPTPPPGPDPQTGEPPERRKDVPLPPALALAALALAALAALRRR